VNEANIKVFDERSYRQFFRGLTGKPAYDYQVEFARELLEGRSLILRAPTGSGKTWAVLVPFLYRHLAQRDCSTTDRIIYALPLRTLASSLYRSTAERIQEFVGATTAVEYRPRERKYSRNDPLYITLQMGGHQDDPFFEGHVVFTTIDQLLSSYLFAPVSLPARVGNIGAGALIGSLVVFDEVHLLDPQRSLATTSEMLDRLNGLAQFVLMTATLPDSVMEWLGRKLSGKSKVLSTHEVLALPSHTSKKRHFSWVPHPLAAQDVLRNHAERTIVIVNSVARAQSLFREVRQNLEGIPGAPVVLLLHSRFFRDDRQHWESQVEEYFGPKATKSNAILISTQVVEAGIDISADVLLTELAPLNSLIQRAGRVARYEPPRNCGRLLVFELSSDRKGRLKLGPYGDQHTIIDTTRSVVARPDDGPCLDYDKELAWLNEVHGVPDLDALAHLGSLSAHRKQVLRAMDGLDESACSRLIRDISTINVILTDKPESVFFGGRRWPQLLGVPRTSLFQLREACANAQDPDWALKVPDQIETVPSGGLTMTWRRCASPAEATWLVAIHPAYASYVKEIGLELGVRSVSVPAQRYTDPPPLPRYSYQSEHFASHADRIVKRARCIVEQQPAMMHALSRLHPEAPIPDLIELTCALHDTGKLQVAWQAEAQRWQRRCDDRNNLGRLSPQTPLAHTTYDPERDKSDPNLPRFPPHASCGAFALSTYLAGRFPPDIALTICTAIARHHGAHTKNLNEYELIADSSGILTQCLPACAPLPLFVRSRADRVDAERFADDWLLVFSDGDEKCWPLYASLARTLRLADQGSFQEQT
jgi:CRISPR-associated endonuclease/helicase Cas3